MKSDTGGDIFVTGEEWISVLVVAAADASCVPFALSLQRLAGIMSDTSRRASTNATPTDLWAATEVLGF